MSDWRDAFRDWQRAVDDEILECLVGWVVVAVVLGAALAIAFLNTWAVVAWGWAALIPSLLFWGLLLPMAIQWAADHGVRDRLARWRRARSRAGRV